MTIWKFVIARTFADIRSQTVQMPAGAQMLTAQIQDGVGLCIWALVDPCAPTKPRQILIMGTGHSIALANIHHIGTVQQSVGEKTLVWHVFEAFAP